jgi:hypothetical protein
MNPIRGLTQISWLLKPLFVEGLDQLRQQQFWLATISMWQMLAIHGL